MSWKQRLHLAYLGHFSRPANERCLYQAVWRHRMSSMVEIGMGTGLRSQRLITAARYVAPDRGVRFTGIDMFEARAADAAGMTLKSAHRMLKPLVHKLQLVPGDPFAALSRMANALGGTDLIVVSADQVGDCLERAWFYLPRMLHENSWVFVQEAGGDAATSRFRAYSREQVIARASALAGPRAA
jgi:hypothetical protein